MISIIINDCLPSARKAAKSKENLNYICKLWDFSFTAHKIDMSQGKYVYTNMWIYLLVVAMHTVYYSYNT